MMTLITVTQKGLVAISALILSKGCVTVIRVMIYSDFLGPAGVLLLKPGVVIEYAVVRCNISPELKPSPRAWRVHGLCMESAWYKL